MLVYPDETLTSHPHVETLWLANIWNGLDVPLNNRNKRDFFLVLRKLYLLRALRTQSTKI